MKHDESLLLSAYLDHELSAEELSRVESHLPQCPSCAQELESLRYIKRLLAGTSRRAMPPEVIASIERQVSRPRIARWLPVLGQRQVLIPAGMLTAAALIVGLWLGATNQNPDQYVPLEPLLAAHARYEAEALVPEGNMVAGNYSYHLANADGLDQE